MKWTKEQRQALKEGRIKGGFAGAPCDDPMSYPIAGPKDVQDAWKLSGKSCNPEKVRQNIIRIAKKYGWESALPKETNTEANLPSQKALFIKGRDRIGSYIVLWGDRSRKDLAGEYFTPETEGLLNIYRALGKLPLIYHHAGDPTIKGTVVGVIDKITKDKIGLWAEGDLFTDSPYYPYIRDAIQKGLLSASSGALPLTRRVGRDGHIESWVITEVSLTPEPVERRMKQHPFRLLNSFNPAMLENYSAIGVQANVIKGLLGQMGVVKARPEALNDKADSSTISQGVSAMDAEKLKALIEELEQQAKDAEARGDSDAAAAFYNQAEGIKRALEEIKADNQTETPPPPPPPAETADMQAPPAKSIMRPPINQELWDMNKSPNDHIAYQFYVSKFGDDTDFTKAVKSVMTGIFGSDFPNLILAQNRAFNKYLRTGRLTRDEEALLQTQIFPASHIKALIQQGMDTSAIKATMVEAQGSLGGFAVPPAMQADIVKRLPGYTVMRAGGATVVTLTRSNEVYAPSFEGGDDVYTTGLRGAWGAEASMPTERNFELGFRKIPAELYTYRVYLSRTLLEDWVDVTNYLTQQIAEVLGLDEDQQFLIGDGAGKPLGVLPGGANVHGFTEVNSGSDTTITDDAVRQMKRALARQYRSRGKFIGNSDTFGVIERIKDNEARPLFPDLTQSSTLLGQEVLESEFMPDIATNAYPVLFCDPSGYWIVERMGLTIERYSDSGTGINRVAFDVRRRIGGAPVEPWRFAVMKISA